MPSRQEPPWHARQTRRPRTVTRAGVTGNRPGLRPARAIDFEQAIDIQRPIEEVFAYLADFTNIPEWNYHFR
jgi:uncharacterized membrane protein